MTDLNSYFDLVSERSKFPCSLGNLGGFVNFRNSGQRGSVKEFTLSLETILSGLKDIRSNINVFSPMTNYVEKEWRDSGSEFFSDLILKSMITVQTKPCFTTFSKIINWATEKDVSKYDDNKIDLTLDSLDCTIEKIESLALTFSPNKQQRIKNKNQSEFKPLHALPLSKPFLLLAGISGTGKTRFVRKQAEFSGKFSETYCLTSVRPDWHEPSDLLGYISRLNGNPEYITTDVLQFIARAWRGIADSELSIEELDTEERGKRLVVTGERDDLDHIMPYWLCLDEMNLAPVEQYFADYLSVLETREWDWADHSFTYSSDALLKPATINEVADNDKLRKALGFEPPEYDELWNLICQYGLAIPFNLIVAGTVNMDETTHGFSRKVIDRALSFDFGAFFPNHYDDFFTASICNKRLSYPIWSQASKDDLSSTVAVDPDGSETVAFLSAVNSVLKNTPFELAFRALNELLIAVISNQPKDELALKAVWDDFMMCKVLPRIEGDSDKLTTTDSKNLLDELNSVLAKQLAPIWQASEADDPSNQRPDLYRERVLVDPAKDEEKLLQIPCRSRAKLKWMSDRLASATFTSFWP